MTARLGMLREMMITAQMLVFNMETTVKHVTLKSIPDTVISIPHKVPRVTCNFLLVFFLRVIPTGLPNMVVFVVTMESRLLGYTNLYMSL